MSRFLGVRTLLSGRRMVAAAGVAAVACSQRSTAGEFVVVPDRFREPLAPVAAEYLTKIHAQSRFLRRFQDLSEVRLLQTQSNY